MAPLCVETRARIMAGTLGGLQTTKQKMARDVLSEEKC
jgi:hypothetical protein